MNTPLPKPPVSLAELVRHLPDATLVGDGSLMVEDVVHPLFAQMAVMSGANPATLLPLILDPKALALLETGLVKVALVSENIDVPEGKIPGYIRIKRPKHVLAYLLSIFDKPVHQPEGIHPTADIHPGAKIHPTAKIGAYASVGEGAVIGENSVILSQATVGAQAVIGKNDLIFSGARIGERVIIGNDVIVQPNACIGNDGFSFVTPAEGSVEEARGGQSNAVKSENTEIIRINSVGTVIIEDNVEIGACACIDRATVGATVIKKNTKIDNLVQIAHNNTIGENCLIVSQVGIAGSCQLGNGVVLAGQVGIADHIKIGHGAIVTAQSGVMRDIEAKTVMGGYPAQPARDFMTQAAISTKLPAMRREIKDLQKRLAALEAELASQNNKEAATV